MDKKDQKLTIAILSKLYRRSLWGKSYTTIENSLSKIPNHKRGQTEEKIEELRKQGLLLYTSDNPVYR